MASQGHAEGNQSAARGREARRGDARNLVLVAHYTLEDAAAGAKLLTGRLESINSYNILASPYGTQAAAKNARARAVIQLADRLVSRIAAWLSGRG